MSDQITILEYEAMEGSTKAFLFSFANDDGKEATPNWIKWTLTDISGKLIINNRENISITPAAQVAIALVGDDLPCINNRDRFLALSVFGTYNSKIAGPSAPFAHYIRIRVRNLPAQV